MDLVEMVLDTLEPVAVPVSIKNAPGRKFLLKEAIGDTAAKFKSASAKLAKMVDGKVVGVENAGDIEPYLVSLCLFEVQPNGEVPVPLAIIRSWSATAVSRLYDKIMEMSPGLLPKESSEVLEKRIAADQAKLAAFRNGDSPEKN